MTIDQNGLGVRERHAKKAVASCRQISKKTLKQVEEMQDKQWSEGLKYDTFLKLNKLWNEYIRTLVGKDSEQSSICSKIVKADLNGAQITIVNTKNATQLGVSGLVVRETRRCLFVITPENEVKNVLKQGNVFELELQHYPFNVRMWGDSIIHMGSERTKVKFKERFSLELY